MLLTRDPGGLALALAKIGAAHGTLRSAESIAHLFITPPRASTRWFDHLFPTHPALEKRVDVLARMGAGLDQRAVADALEAGHRHHEAAVAEEAARSAKARRRDRPGPAGMDAEAVGPTAESDARAASGIPVYQRPDGPFTYGSFTLRSVAYDVTGAG